MDPLKEGKKLAQVVLSPGGFLNVASIATSLLSFFAKEESDVGICQDLRTLIRSFVASYGRTVRKESMKRPSATFVDILTAE